MNTKIFCPDLELVRECESCRRQSDHIMVTHIGMALVVAHICYECSTLIDFEHRHMFLPKVNATKRNYKCTINSSKQPDAPFGEYKGDQEEIK